MLIHVFARDTAESTAFQTNTGAGSALDFTDWSLDAATIGKWQTIPAITEKAYSDIGIYEIDMNNQRWPLGVTENRTYDPLSGTYKHYYTENPASTATYPWDMKARQFRVAIAYLSDKKGWIEKFVEV